MLTLHSSGVSSIHAMGAVAIVHDFFAPERFMKISVLIPCHNEEKFVQKCVESCLAQTRKAEQILVVNDGSTDRSALVLAQFQGYIDVLALPSATGNKSYAQQHGLPYITGDVFVTLDGDTILDPNFLKYVEEDFTAHPSACAVSGYVKSLKYNWLTAVRELDYIIGQDLYKTAQSYIGALFVIPGCAGAFKTETFRACIDFDHDTLTEDLDFTYKFHERYLPIVYDRRAVAYTQDPATLAQYANQMRRWYAGGWQNLRKHYRLLGKPNNSLALSLMYVEGLIFAAILFLLPMIDIRYFEIFFIPYAVFILGLGTYAAFVRKRFDLLLYSPAYVILLYVNSAIFLEQFWKEIVLRKTNLVWFHPERRET